MNIVSASVFILVLAFCVYNYECNVCPHNCACHGSMLECDLQQTDGKLMPDLPTGTDHVILHNWGRWNLTWNNVKHLELFDTMCTVKDPILQLRNLTSLKIYTFNFVEYFNILDIQSQIGVKELYFIGIKRLSFENISSLLRGSKFSEVEVLVIDRISSNNDDPILSIESDFFKTLYTKTELRRLDLIDLNLNTIDFLSTRCPPKLNYLSLKGSIINKVKTYYQDDMTHVCETLDTLDISETNFRAVRDKFKAAQYFNNIYITAQVIKLFLFRYFFKVENVLINNFNDEPVEIRGVTLDVSSYKTRFRNVNLSKNYLTFVNGTYISNAEYGIEEYDLSLNMMEYLSPRLLNPAGALRKLDLRSNNLYKMQTDFPSDFEIMFQSYSNLTYLDISNNGLTAIPQAMFTQNEKLRHLDLGQNQLSKISFSLVSCLELGYLNLRGNKIFIHDMNSIKHLHNLFSVMRGIMVLNKTPRTTKNNLMVDLTGSSFSCSCDNTKLQNWIVENSDMFLSNMNEGYVCTFKEKTYNVMTSEVKDIWMYCSQQRRLRLALVLAASGLAFILLLLLTIFLIRRRLIRYKKIRRLLRYLQCDELPLQFLMFLSHCSADDELFIEYILPTLSQSMKEVTKTSRDYICFGDKHFRPGHTIVEEVMRCIEQSAVVVLVISNKYIKSPWCDMEAKEAATQQKPVILILTENIDEEKMSPVLKHLFNRFTRFKCFTSKEGQHEVSPMWSTLSSSVLELATDQVNV